MAILSQMCVLPEGWSAPSHVQGVGMSKKQEWKAAKRLERERMMAYRERERKRAKRRGVSGSSLGSDRKRVYCETMSETIGIENREKMFFYGKGELQPKKAKNTFSREQAGTIGRVITVKRFQGSRLTCVCKSIII